IRRSPLGPSGAELTFPDRFSLAAIGIEAYLGAPDDERDRVAEHFYNDAYWFDQLGCSSPRLAVRVGAEGRDDEARHDLAGRLERVIRDKAFRVETGTAIAKLTYACDAVLDHGVEAVVPSGNELVMLELPRFADVRGEFCGAGLFFNLR